MTTRNKMNQKHQGTYSELIACNWLLSLGYDVFRNISPHGKADIIAWNPENDESLYIDVKTASIYTSVSGEDRLHFPMPAKPHENVVYLVVNPKDNSCFFANMP